jgi:branched-chain amino acid transport system permease protein
MLQVLVNGIIAGGIYALMSIGFNLVFASVRFHHLAYGSLAVFGAYFTKLFKDDLGLNYFVAMLLAATIFGFIGLLIWLVVYKPIKRKGASSVALLVASFGLLLVFQNLTSLIFSPNAKALVLTSEIREAYTVLGAKITFNQLVIIAVTVLVVILFELILTKTKLGSAIRAVGQNAELARVVGVPADKILFYTFFIATFVSVIGASLNALEVGLRPTLGLVLILKVIIAAIIGGIGSVRGGLYGGILLGVAENIGIFVLGARWQDTVAFTLLVLFLLFKPEGLFSTFCSRKI